MTTTLDRPTITADLYPPSTGRPLRFGARIVANIGGAPCACTVLRVTDGGLAYPFGMEVAEYTVDSSDGNGNFTQFYNYAPPTDPSDPPDPTTGVGFFDATADAAGSYDGLLPGGWMWHIPDVAP